VTYISATLRRLVISRAGGRCEYCLLPDALSFYPHECDHVTAEKHEGLTVEWNLCLSCWICNRHKGTDLTSLDPLTGKITPLFNPRIHDWFEHFRLNGAIIEGITPEGRTTVRLLHFNDDEQVAIREDLIQRGRYP